MPTDRDALLAETEACRAFRGRDPGIGTLMRDRGFPVPAETKAGQ